MVVQQIFMLENLNCPSCAANLERAVQKLPGTHSARVAFGAGTLTATYDERLLSEARLREVVAQFGVGVSMVLSGSR